MRRYSAYLNEQLSQGTQAAELAAKLMMLELPNLFALLEQVNRAGDAAATIIRTESCPFLTSRQLVEAVETKG